MRKIKHKKTSVRCKTNFTTGKLRTWQRRKPNPFCVVDVTVNKMV
jgi:hypothetical protein